ncbi:MAG: hypothetical protein QNI96_10140 [Woeseiaceae bacterium]|nr:hypothetical protein [Woeseiaceae bacterium]
MQKSDADKQEREVLELLQDYPAPAPDRGFYERALVRATHEGSKRQRNRWMMTGFGAAIAATIAAWVIGGMLLNEPQLPEAASTIPGVTIALAEPRTVNLVFASAKALDSATLTVTLPDGIELDGFPGQREITWETSLSEGRNLLPLTLVAVTPTGGELLARLEHEDRDRTFRLQVEVG